MDQNTDANAALRNLICFNFYRGWRGISEFYRRSLPDNISAQQSYILDICSEDSGVLVGEIAAALEIELSAISSMLRRMEGSGLITRSVKASNRRQTLVYLTPEGSEMKIEVRKKMVLADKELRKIIPEDMIKELVGIVDHIRKL